MRRSGLLVILLLLPMVFGSACSSEKEVDGRKVTEWVSMLRSDDWTARAQAQDTLARMGADAVPYIRRLVRAKDPTLRRSVILTLGKIGAPAKEVVPSLLRRMKVEKVSVIRAEILRALAEIDPRAEGVPEEFEKRLKDLESVVRKAAQAGLDKLKPPEPEEKKPVEVKSPAKPEGFALRELVDAELSKQGVAFGLVAEVVRETRRAAIVWPAIKEGKVLDDDIVAFVFEETKGSGWTLVEANLLLSQGQGPDKLVTALGGADKQRVVRTCGVERDALPAYLEEKGKAFKEALGAGKTAEAIQAYEDLTRVFSFRIGAYDDMLPEMLITETLVEPPWKFKPEPGNNTCAVEVQAKGKTIKGTLRLSSCGDGFVISDLKE